MTRLNKSEIRHCKMLDGMPGILQRLLGERDTQSSHHRVLEANFQS